MIDTIIFDLGGVLIDWNPRYVYKQLYLTEDAMEHFLSEICTNSWNEKQDEGRSFQEATELLINNFPEYKNEIIAYYSRWKDMLGGPIHATVDIFSKLRDLNKYRIFALTNWSDESFPVALEMFDFLHWFDGIVVSGAEKLKKPDPDIFRVLFDRYNINSVNAVFIDDNHANIVAARQLGLNTIHFLSSEQCKHALSEYNIEVY